MCCGQTWCKLDVGKLTKSHPGLRTKKPGCAALVQGPHIALNGPIFRPTFPEFCGPMHAYQIWSGSVEVYRSYSRHTHFLDPKVITV